MTEHPSIAHRDWRLHAITTTTAPHRSASGVLYPEGTTVQLGGFLQLDLETMAVPVADASAMYVDLARMASLAGRRTRAALLGLPEPGSGQIPMRRVLEAGETEFIDGLQSILASVIFSYTAIEAFANMVIPADFVYRRPRADKRCTEEYGRSQIERHLSLAEKLHEILPLLTNIPTAKGTVVWEDFVFLKRLRDRLIHLKRADWRDQQAENAPNSVWSALLTPEVATIYTVPIDVAWHYTARDRPRWVSKARELALADAA